MYSFGSVVARRVSMKPRQYSKKISKQKPQVKEVKS
jgi:hypothetical protein